MGAKNNESKNTKNQTPKGGLEVGNKYTILSEIDKALGVDKPPAIEYSTLFSLQNKKVKIKWESWCSLLLAVFVEPYSDFNPPYLWFGLSRNPYGQYVERKKTNQSRFISQVKNNNSAAVRYTLPDGEQVLMNIVGRKGVR